jgi:hypothetical protein
MVDDSMASVATSRAPGWGRGAHTADKVISPRKDAPASANGDDCDGADSTQRIDSVNPSTATPLPPGTPGELLLHPLACRGPAGHHDTGPGYQGSGGSARLGGRPAIPRTRATAPAGPKNTASRGVDQTFPAAPAPYHPVAGLGHPLSIPHAAAARTAPCQASAGVLPTTRIRFSPFDPSTRQTVAPFGPIRTTRPVLQPEPLSRAWDSSAGG